MIKKEIFNIDDGIHPYAYDVGTLRALTRIFVVAYGNEDMTITATIRIRQDTFSLPLLYVLLPAHAREGMMQTGKSNQRQI